MKYSFYGNIYKETPIHMWSITVNNVGIYSDLISNIKYFERKLNSFDEKAIIKRKDVIGKTYLFSNDTEFQLKIGDKIVHKNESYKIASQEYDHLKDEMICVLDYESKVVHATEEEMQNCCNVAKNHLLSLLDDAKRLNNRLETEATNKKWYKFWS